MRWLNLVSRISETIAGDDADWSGGKAVFVLGASGRERSEDEGEGWDEHEVAYANDVVSCKYFYKIYLRGL